MCFIVCHFIALVLDWTPCGVDSICIGLQCVPKPQFHTKCANCSKTGSCTNHGTCYCQPGWTGNDCTTRVTKDAAKDKNTDLPEEKDDKSVANTNLSQKDNKSVASAAVPNKCVTVGPLLTAFLVIVLPIVYNNTIFIDDQN